MAPWKRGRKKPAIPVWIVENHPLAAERLREILRRSGRVKVSTHVCAGTGRTCLCEGPSVAVVDRDTLPQPLDESLQSLRLELPRAKTLVLGRTICCEEICRLLFLGAKGFVPYEEVEGRLDSAIRAVWGGHLWVSAEVLEEFTGQASKLSQTEARGGRLFTPAENRALGFLRLRLSNKEIASKMEISERTVKFHLGNIFTKLGVHDRYSIIEMLKTGKLSGLGDACREGRNGEG